MIKEQDIRSDTRQFILDGIEPFEIHEMIESMYGECSGIVEQELEKHNELLRD